MGEGREVLANGQGGGLGAKSAHLDGGHIFKGGVARALDLIEMDLKLFEGTKGWRPGPKIYERRKGIRLGGGGGGRRQWI